MTYVPFVPPPPPSPRARELGKRLADSISAFRGEHPDLSDLEITHALQLARRQVGMRNTGVMIGILIALVAMGISAFILFSRQLLFEKQTIIYMAGITAGIVILVVVYVFRNR